MDERIRKSLEHWVGFNLPELSENEIYINTSPKRSDNPYNRLVINRIVGYQGLIVTCIPRLTETITKLLESISLFELFSPFGEQEIRRVLARSDTSSFGSGFTYVLTDVSS